MKMKGLNNKGFTLIELLAVIVILALVVGITIPSVLSAMNNSRVSTLHTTAVAVKNWYNETVAQDELMSASDKTIPVELVQNLVTNDGTWYCLSAVPHSNADGTGSTGTTDLATLYGLSGSNFNIASSTAPNDTTNYSSSTCSAIRYNGGEIEVLLVAATSGRYNVNSYVVTYAISSEENGCTGGRGGTCEQITNPDSGE